MTESQETPADSMVGAHVEQAPHVEAPSEALPPQDDGASPLVPPSEARPHTDGTAVAALVCAIGSWFLLPVVLAVVALVLAGRAERSTQADRSASGLGLVTGARWVAWINLTLAAMVVAFLAAFTVAIWLGR